MLVLAALHHSVQGEEEPRGTDRALPGSLLPFPQPGLELLP